MLGTSSVLRLREREPMAGMDAVRTRRPSQLLAAGVTLALSTGMVYLWVAVYPHRLAPLTYALPLLIGLWHRDRLLLWAMAVCFMVVSTIKVVVLIPDESFDYYSQQYLFMVMQWLDIVVPAGVVHLVLIYRQWLERSNESLATANAELEASNEELETNNEELAAVETKISRQNEVLRVQTEELEQKAKGLQTQAEELQVLNKELQESQRRVEAYRDRYIDLYDFAPLGYVTLDEEGYVQEINLNGQAAGTRTVGVGYPFADQVAVPDKAIFLEHVCECSKVHREVTSDLSLLAQDGRLLTVQLHSLPVADLEADLTFCKTAITDITERKRLEQRLLRLNSWKERLLGPNSLRQKLKFITDGMVDVLGADFARIWVLQESDLCEQGCRCAAVTEGPDVCRDRTHCFHLLASSGRYSRVDGSHCRVPCRHKIGRVASGIDINFVTNDVAHDPHVHDHQWAESLGLVSFAAIDSHRPRASHWASWRCSVRGRSMPAKRPCCKTLPTRRRRSSGLEWRKRRLEQAHDELEERVQQRTATLVETVQALRTEIGDHRWARQALQDAQDQLRYLLAESPAVI